MDLSLLRSVLQDYLCRLDQDHRYTLMLHYVDQLTPREISMVLDRSYAWVVEALSRIEAEVASLIRSSKASDEPRCMRRVTAL